MLGSIKQNLFTGLVAILPVVLTLYLLYWLVVSAESALGRMIRLVLPDNLYWPGMQVIGFVTQAVPEHLPEDFREEGSILVYLPLSYMIGGMQY